MLALSLQKNQKQISSANTQKNYNTIYNHIPHLYLYFMEPANKTIFKIPTDLTQKKQTFVIGIIDASGSMSSYWEEMVKFWNDSVAPMAKMVITFSNSAKVEKSPILSSKLSNHGGGGTNILSAFQLLQRQIQEFITEISFTIIFISDGQDTTHRNRLPEEISKLLGSKGRYINFICLGVQSGFPTTIAMSLRQKYHTGQQNIPAIYLIQYASEKAFFNKFQTMKNCFTSFGQVQVFPLASAYPWQNKLTNTFYEGTWVIFNTTVNEIQITGSEGKKKYEVPSLKSLSIDDLTDCFRGWIQKIQLLNIEAVKTKGNVKEISQKTLDVVLQIVKKYEKQNNMNIISEKENSLKTFKSRAVDFMVRNLGVRIKWYIDELTVFIKGVGANQLNQYEAAKRIGIGTITGKYHQKALALKGITAADFNVIKNEFKDIYEKIKLSNQPSSQESSIFTLQNQKEVFSEPDFLEGLQLCKTQYDLVQTFPVIGYSLKVKRHDGSMVNPWKVMVTKLAKHHNSIDSMYLAKNQNKFELNIGDGAVQQINAVLPLFSLKDKEMSPLLNSRLFKLAISFMVVQNIDTYYPEAYFALLASTYIYLLTAEKSQWRDNLIKSIYESIKITYGEEDSFKQKIAAIEKDPFELFKIDEEVKQQHVDISKVLIYIFFIANQGNLSKSQIAHLVDLALCHYAQKTFVEHQFKLNKFIDIETEKFGMKQEIGVNNFETFKELNEICKEKIREGLLSQNCVTLNAKNFIKNDSSDKQRVSFNHMKEFHLNITGNQINDDDVFYYFAHYLEGKESINYSKPIVKDQKLAKKIILGKFDFNTEFKDQNYITKHLKNVRDVYLDNFSKTHFGIVPLTKEKLVKLCEQRNINPTTLKLNQASGLLSNACQSPSCSFYLKPLKSGIIQHMRLWKRKLPNQFHLMVKKYSNLKDPVIIYQKIDPILNFKRYGKEKDFVIKYINEILEAFQAK